MAGWFNVAKETEFSPGESRLIDVDNVMVAVFNIEGEYFAIEDRCTHDDAPMLGSGMETEDIVEGSEIICPRHGARFCIKSGAALTAPAFEATETFPVRIEDGMVQVTDPRWD